MGEMAEELQQLQQQQELFQAEQVATALAQALEAERERIRKQEENALAQTARANELEEAYKKRAEELERTAMEAAARVREESLKQVQEVTEMFVKSLAAGTAVERAAAAELVSRGLTGASTDAIAGGTEVEGAFGSPASVERPKEEEEDEDEEDGVVPTMDAARDPDLVLAEFDAAAEAILRGEKSDAAAKMLADAAAAAAASKPAAGPPTRKTTSRMRLATSTCDRRRKIPTTTTSWTRSASSSARSSASPRPRSPRSPSRYTAARPGPSHPPMRPRRETSRRRPGLKIPWTIGTRR